MKTTWIQPVILLCAAAYGFCFPLNYSCTLQRREDNYGRDYSDNRSVLAVTDHCHGEYGTQTNGTYERKAAKDADLLSSDGHCQPRCVATAWNHKELYLLQSTEVTKSAKGCRVSLDHCSSCQLSPSHHTFYPDQPSFTSTVDLGSCVGTCSSNKSSSSCIPIRSTTIPIKGPNGYKTASKTTRCGCAFSKCYRQEYFMEVKMQSSQNSKLVDVGKCVGTCVGETVTVCIPTKANCIISFQQPSNICAPTSTIKDSDVHIIKSCGCGLY